MYKDRSTLAYFPPSISSPPDLTFSPIIFSYFKFKLLVSFFLSPSRPSPLSPTLPLTLTLPPLSLSQVYTTFFIEQDLLVEEVSLISLVLQLLNFAVDELSKVLEVEESGEELLHLGPGLDEPREGGRERGEGGEGRGRGERGRERGREGRREGGKEGERERRDMQQEEKRGKTRMI